MIEILVVIALCKNARENAMQRGQSGGIAILYTILLWFGMEIYTGFLFGIIFSLLGVDNGLQLLIYIFALAGAALGGYIAILISKVKPPIDLFAQNNNTVPGINQIENN